MADGLHFDRKNRPYIYFQDLGGVRRKFRLSQMNKRDAASFASRFGELVSSVRAGLVPNPLILQWVSRLEVRYQIVLQRHGFVCSQPNQQLTLVQARDRYLSLKSGKKPSTRRNILTASERILKILGGKTLISSLTRGACEQAVAALQSTHAKASVSQSVKRVKSILEHAVNLELIKQNPMAKIKAGSDEGDPELQFFVNQELAEKVLQACPNAEWRLIFGLARYGGIRVPSELVPLEWKHIEWEKHRFYVPSSKTEQHVGKKGRWVPIFKELLPLLRDVYQESQRKTGPVILKYRDSESDNPRTHLVRIIQAAGINPWPKPFTNLRATRDTELRRAGVPDYKVDAWLGHSLKVAKKHYLQIIDEDYALAAGVGSASGENLKPVGGPAKTKDTLRSLPPGIVLYTQDLNKVGPKTGISGAAASWFKEGAKWLRCGSDSAKSGSKIDSASACNKLQAVTQGLENKGVLRDSAGDCSLLQEEKAPRLGLEPRTCELTARRSTN